MNDYKKIYIYELLMLAQEQGLRLKSKPFCVKK